VEDLGSKNGLTVNGVAAERGPRTLRAGDELAVGDTLLALADPDAERGSPADAPRDPIPPSRSLARGRGPAQVAAALLALAAAVALAGL
jgi:pSer/pThr/pTyr-binding forkhead associated (FHA) protein